MGARLGRPGKPFLAAAVRVATSGGRTQMGRGSERPPASVTESCVGPIPRLAGRADRPKLSCALTEELSFVEILVAARWAEHHSSQSRYFGASLMVRKIRSDVKRGARDPEVTLCVVSVSSES